METVRENRRNRKTKLIAMFIAIVLHGAAAAAIWYSGHAEEEEPVVEKQSQELTLQILLEDATKGSV